MCANLFWQFGHVDEMVSILVDKIGNCALFASMHHNIGSSRPHKLILMQYNQGQQPIIENIASIIIMIDSPTSISRVVHVLMPNLY